MEQLDDNILIRRLVRALDGRTDLGATISIDAWASQKSFERKDGGPDGDGAEPSWPVAEEGHACVGHGSRREVDAEDYRVLTALSSARSWIGCLVIRDDRLPRFGRGDWC
jgi:hypothetical protein